MATELLWLLLWLLLLLCCVWCCCCVVVLWLWCGVSCCVRCCGVVWCAVWCVVCDTLKNPVCPFNTSRVYVTGTTRTHLSTCARGAGIHGWTDTRGAGVHRQFRLPEFAHVWLSRASEVHQRNFWIFPIFKFEKFTNTQTHVAHVTPTRTDGRNSQARSEPKPATSPSCFVHFLRKRAACGQEEDWTKVRNSMLGVATIRAQKQAKQPCRSGWLWK